MFTDNGIQKQYANMNMLIQKKHRLTYYVVDESDFNEQSSPGSFFHT